MVTGEDNGGNHLYMPSVTVADFNTITAATNASPIVITSNGHGLQNNDRVRIEGVSGNTAANGTFTVGGRTDDTFELHAAAGNGIYTNDTGGWYEPNLIDSVTNADPIVVTTAANHNLTLNADHWIWIEGVGGVTKANGLHEVEWMAMPVSLPSREKTAGARPM